jgi:hypothetical protein
MQDGKQSSLAEDTSRKSWPDWDARGSSAVHCESASDRTLASSITSAKLTEVFVQGKRLVGRREKDRLDEKRSRGFVFTDDANCLLFGLFASRVCDTRR